MLKSAMIIVLCVGLASVKYAASPMSGLPELKTGEGDRLMVGTMQHEVVDVTSADVVPAITNCRCIYADVGGIVKISYVAPQGDTMTEVIALNDATFYPVRNVTKVFRYYTGTTATTCKAYSAAGAQVNGIKLRR
jgi:hypothetical protein